MNITTLAPNNPAPLITALTTNTTITASRAQQIAQQAGPGPFGSPLEFFVRGGMSQSEIAQVEPNIRGTRTRGLVNVNTANSTVLACVPGLTNGQALQLTAYRQSNTNLNGTVGWVTQVLSQSDAITAGPWLTGKGYQYMADVAAIGHNGRGYRRTRFVFDTSSGTPVLIYRQDLSHLGWALGKQVREEWLTAKKTP